MRGARPVGIAALSLAREPVCSSASASETLGRDKKTHIRGDRAAIEMIFVIPVRYNGDSTALFRCSVAIGGKLRFLSVFSGRLLRVIASCELAFVS